MTFRYQFSVDPLNAAHVGALGTIFKVLSDAGIKIIAGAPEAAQQPVPAPAHPVQPQKVDRLPKPRRVTKSQSPKKTGIPPVDVDIVSESLDRKLVVRRRDNGEELLSNLGLAEVLGISYKACKMQDRRLTSLWVKASTQKPFVAAPIRGLWEALRGIQCLGIDKFPDEASFLKDVAALRTLGNKEPESKGPEEIVTPQEPDPPALPPVPQARPVAVVAQAAAAVVKKGPKIPVITNNSSIRDIDEVVEFLKGSMTHTNGGKCLRIWTPRGSTELGVGWKHVPRAVFRKLNRWVEDQLEAEGRHR